ncbi:ferric reductase like transmembrane component [Rhizodiscina lignyota]|uniref:Ferric reductase like transmembrane component n=1 Tax=Rhizodiscina lignyota TaxID=1504668 RepID=A0A9P4IT09_9PEZI|nr:ferric reductase like transmembrane component [Rhizodiscina lignyota]
MTAGRNGHGLIGYGITMYKPPCCFSCRAVLASSMLNCSASMDMSDGGMDMGGDMNSPECYATDDAFLQSLALCIKQRCIGDETLDDWKIEKYWQENVAGTAQVQPDPKETYEAALVKIHGTVTETLVSGDSLNRTMLVGDSDYQENWNALVAFEDIEDTHERYALVVLLSGFVIPVGFSLLRFIPFPSGWTAKFYALFIDPPAIGSRHKVPILWNLTNMPTRGQAFFIFYLTAINIILSCVGYHSRQPNAWYPAGANGTDGEITYYVTNRLGVLSFANIPLLILYAGRNNILLWLTNWSYETFLILHRYVAGIATLQAVLHSVIYLAIYIHDGDHRSESKLPYWYWGAIATLGMSILLPTSILPLRQRLYELFLMWHVALSVLIVAGCYLHIIYRFQHQWGYEVWILTAYAVWGFDRLVRLLRLARNGIRRAKVTVIDEDYVRVDIAGVSGNGHAYLYFPTLTWRVWENHPFSVASTVLPASGSSSGGNHLQTGDIEKSGARSDIAPRTSEDGASSEQDRLQPPTLGLTFLLRTRSGLTSALRLHGDIPVLVESPYGQRPDFSTHPTMVCIAGGVGITAVLPLLRAHPGKAKLFWGVRSRGIVDAMEESLREVEKELFVGHRMNIAQELEGELRHSGNDAVVVVSGPASMADDARNAVCSLTLKGKNVAVRLVEESFSW